MLIFLLDGVEKAKKAGGCDEPPALLYRILI
jgi:hypothetical protein